MSEPLRFPDLPGWSFDIRETQPGVYRVDGVGDQGLRVGGLVTDVDGFLDDCKTWIRETERKLSEPHAQPDQPSA